MKKLVLCLVLIICGCTHSDEAPHGLQFNIGDVVDLKVGGQGQVINIKGISKPYHVRIRTNIGLTIIWLDEFELENHED